MQFHKKPAHPWLREQAVLLSHSPEEGWDPQAVSITEATLDSPSRSKPNCSVDGFLGSCLLVQGLALKSELRVENNFGLLLQFQTSEVKVSRVSRTLRLRILACWTYLRLQLRMPRSAVLKSSGKGAVLLKQRSREILAQWLVKATARVYL